MGGMTSINLGHVTDTWTGAAAGRSLRADMKMTSHSASLDDLKMPNEGSVFGSGPNVKFTVAQKSNTDNANFREGVRMEHVEESAGRDRRLEALAQAKMGERVQYT